MNVDMQAIKKLQDAADVANAAWIKAGGYALANHASYVLGLKTNKAASLAYLELHGYVAQVYQSLLQTSDPWQDGSWLPTIGGIRDDAQQHIDLLAKLRVQLIDDMAHHIQLSLSPSDQAKALGVLGVNPEAAAAAVDKADQVVPRNPNARTPGTQDTSHPAVDVPPAADTPWGMIAIGAGLGLLVLKMVWR